MTKEWPFGAKVAEALKQAERYARERAEAVANPEDAQEWLRVAESLDDSLEQDPRGRHEA